LPKNNTKNSQIDQKRAFCYTSSTVNKGARMQIKNIETNEAPAKWWASQDARMRNLANKSHYSAQTHVRVQRMVMALDHCYSARAIHEAFGKNGVSIKIDRPGGVRDRVNLRLLEQDWAQAGVTKKVSAQGIIYRFKAD